jgi:DNA modification methylase
MARTDPRPHYGTKRRVRGDGYIDVFEPAHPLARRDGYIMEHRKVAWDAGLFNDPLLQIHHLNGDRTDNRLENLKATTPSEHSRHHASLALQMLEPRLFVDDGDFQLWNGDALETLRTLPNESVHCVVTSPPYWGLRDYGTGLWEGGDPDCDHARPTTTYNAGFNERWGQGGGQLKQERKSEGQYAQECAKCGAQRQDRQLGLEPTPDAYVAAMVEVFREVRRVLAAHGTVWLNLGDSYAASGVSGLNVKGETSTLVGSANAAHTTQRKEVPAGLKPKDLVGIPWRVAFALQQPYYTGRIKDERDRLWLAAMVDTEGCIHIHKRAAGAKSHTHTLADGTQTVYERKTDTYGVMVSIDNTSRALIDRIAELVGQGSRYTHEKGVGKSNRKQTLYRITLTGQQSRELLRELYPDLVAKRQEARIAYHAPSSGPGAEEAWQAIKALHNGLHTTVDYPEPPTLYEPGWYLRSDVIWGKPNPMPESVTDRPTRSHEYVFLLTKGPRYFFDQEAVREPQHHDGRTVTVAIGRENSVQHRDGERWPNPSGRNVRSVWTIATEPYPGAHFATFPRELARRCIVAGCPVRVCGTCGKPSERIVETERPDLSAFAHRRTSKTDPGMMRNDGESAAGRLSGQEWNRLTSRETVGWSDCGHGSYRPGVVLDPFAGSGTVALVARQHGRRSVGIELNPAYCALAAERLSQLSLLSEASL